MSCALHVQFVSVLRPPGAMNLSSMDIDDLDERVQQEWRMVSSYT